VCSSDLNISQYSRPIRIAFLVNKNSFLDAIQFNTSLWGGIYNPIIPINKNQSKIEKQNIINILNNFDADLIVNLTLFKYDFIEKIFPETFNILDDPTLEFFPHSSPIDEEGVPTKKKYIVKDGILKSFLFDLYTGSKYGTGSTGNGFKRSLFTSSIFMSPSPHFTTLVIEPGDNTYEEMIAGMKEGVIADYLVGAHSGNVLSGDLSANIGIGFYVKNGEIAGRAMDSMISGNIYKFFHNIKMIGKTPVLDSFNHCQFCPHLLFEDMNVSGAG